MKRFLSFIIVIVFCSIMPAIADQRANDCQMGHVYNDLDANQFGFEDFSGMEYSDKYFVLLDPAQCGACPSGICIDNLQFATYINFDDTSFSFNVVLYGATDTGGGCYEPDLSDVRATAGPFDFVDLAEGAYSIASDPLTGPDWCISPIEPVFIGFEWTTPPGAWEMDFLCNSGACDTCNLYFENPSVPGETVDFCNTLDWTNSGSPYIWSEVSCFGTPDVPSMNLMGLLILLGFVGFMIRKR